MLQAQEIVTLACQIAKCPGFTTQGGQFLNVVLETLAIKQNLDSIRRTTTLNLVAGTASYSLPANFLRPRQVTYLVNGVATAPTEISYEAFKTLPQIEGISSYPEQYAIDMGPTGAAIPGPPVMYLYPAPGVALTMTVLYQDDTVTITNPQTSTTIPWFIDQEYLITATAAKLMKITDDTRQVTLRAEAQDALRSYLQLNNGNVLKTVTLDPRTFRTANRFPPSKYIP